jgi:hypothetical protein
LTDDPGWTDNPATLLRYRVTLAMQQGESDPVEIAHTLGCAPTEVSDVFEWLVRNEMAGQPQRRRLGEKAPTSARLNGLGRAAAEGWRASSTPGRMKRACEAALLSWLDANEGKTFASTNELMEDVRGYYFGQPFTEETIGTAAKELLEHRLIRGHRTSVPVVLRPEITPLGRSVLIQHHGELGAWLANSSSRGGGDTFHITGSTGVTVANRSPGAHQSVHVTTDAREQVLNLAAALEQMMPSLGLAPADEATAFGLVGRLRNAAEEVVEKPGRVRPLLDAVKQVAVSGSGAAAGTGLVALAEVVAHAISHLS